MKQLSLLFTLSLFSVFSLAQDENTPRKTEFGINVLDLIQREISLHMRVKNKRGAWRFELTDIRAGSSSHLSNENSVDLFRSSFGLQANVGYEFRIPIGEKSQFRYGADLIAGANIAHFKEVSSASLTTEATNSQRFTLGAQAVVGFYHFFTPKLSAGIELNPDITYSKRINNYNDSDGTAWSSIRTSLDGGFSLGSAEFLLFYTF